MITLVANMQAKPGKENELEAALQVHFPKVQLEKGTAAYVLHRSTEKVGQFFFYEKYQDQQALDYHGSTPYLKELFSSIADLLLEKPEVKLYEEVAAISR
ncbi:putative quinol monooxygenase [Pelosinus fermentans]|uniref:Antibiotic biosynthesis monooxygenase n=1 Tax=Pelosinus fermentans JBW45 TaxID=1192197 RepID=I9NRM8_9FIRM|nr:putative quinol monooxygenase [Pelosinus fermentans]AJQ26484.1 Antibiotic biosynthesis monooxygenase [Pelosinus fermentans JBW45]